MPAGIAVNVSDVEAVREELGEAIHLNENLGAPSARAMQKLFAAIDAEPARKPAISFNLAGKITDFFASLAPRTMAYASAAAAIAILLQAGVIGTVLVKDQGGKFQSASFSDNHPEAGAYALVQFTPDAKAGDIMAFLGSYDAWIVEGPKAGMFRVRLGDKPLSKTELDGLLTKLQGEKVISFVAPAQ